MDYEDNMSGWRKALQRLGVKTLGFEESMINESKLESIARLEKSNLPRYEHYLFELSDLYVNQCKNNSDLIAIARDYEGLVMRAIPKQAEHQRITCINKNLEEARTYFSEKANGKIDAYYLLVNEYDPAKYCGIVISKPNKLIIDMVEDENLEKLAHGKVIPWSAQFSENLHGFYQMQYLNVNNRDVNGIEIRKRMWGVVKYLSDCSFGDGGIPKFKPRQGYFEYVISKRSGEMKFVDCREI
jgi:hypothetical protein